MVLLFTGVRGTRLRSAELSPLGTWRKHERAGGDAGPYGVRLSGCAGIRETADMDATVPLHDNRPARLRAVRGSGSGDGGTSDSMRNLFVPWLESDKGNPKTVGFWRRSFPYFFRCEKKYGRRRHREKGCRAAAAKSDPRPGARNIPAGGSDPSAAGGGYSEVSEWPRSKFQAPAVRQRRNFGHRSSVPFRT